MTFELAAEKGKFIRRVNFVQWIFRNHSGAWTWRHWNSPFNFSKEDLEAQDWVVWDGTINELGPKAFGPLETKDI